MRWVVAVLWLLCRLYPLSASITLHSHPFILRTATERFAIKLGCHTCTSAPLGLLGAQSNARFPGSIPRKAIH